MAGNCGWLWAIFWFFALIFVGWPVAFILDWFYIIFLPFSVCIDCCKQVCEFLLKGVQLPLLCAENMVGQKSLC